MQHSHDDVSGIDVNALLTKEWLARELGRSTSFDYDIKEMKTLEITQNHDRPFSVVIFFKVGFITVGQQTIEENMVLKICKPDGDTGQMHGKSEIDFYQTLMPLGKKDAYWHIYTIGYVEMFHSYYILMKDLSDSWYARRFHSQSYTMDELELFVTQIARFHAEWWDNPLLGTEVGRYMDREGFCRLHKESHDYYENFMRTASESIPNEHKLIYERALRNPEMLFERLNQRKNLTLIHGDLHLGNVMFPHDLNRKQILLLDWDLWGVHMAMKDLSVAISLSFYRHKRKKIEESLLKLYHESLMQYGVSDYSWDDMMFDYKLGVITMLFSPMYLLKANDTPNIWWGDYVRSMMAFEDFNCMEMLS